MFEISAHYVNKGTKTLSPFLDGSVDDVLLQTNPDPPPSMPLVQTLFALVVIVRPKSAVFWTNFSPKIPNIAC